ncbi:MAG TPA: hypothetical protein VH088_11560 [Terriglobales bacterium]|jgi:hypothetical protein|nr:hypothetical protein [Terriglobales bacterium]
MKLARIFVGLLPLLPLLAAAQAIGTLTLKDAPVRLIRGTTILQAPEGMRLRTGDILETADKGFAQLELNDGKIIALGSSTRLLILGRGSQEGELVILTGWLKGEASACTAPCLYASPRLAAASKGGTVLLHSTPESSEAYFESGAGTVSQVNSAGGKTSPLPAKQGQFFARRAGKNVVPAARPDAAFLEAMPVPFRDTLPSRLARFAAKAVEPKVDREVNYADVEPWLKIGVAWRRGFVERFRSRLNDPEFRRAIDAHMSSHPEWDPILHPEKYKPDTAESTAPRGR